LNSGTRSPDCFLNGPNAILCISQDVENPIAWVLDPHTGQVSYHGPTDLRTYPAKLKVRQVGIYAVAATQYQGVYGVGPKADTTWFIPGDGTIDRTYLPDGDTVPPTLASQNKPGRRSDSKVVFSLKDGRVINPEVDPGAKQWTTVIYPGGFAAEISLGLGRDRVHFFDDTGRQTSRTSVEGSLDHYALDLPVVVSSNQDWAVYTPQGRKLLQESGSTPFPTRLIGDSLFVKDTSDTMVTRWRRYDLRTGEQGKVCNFNMDGGYIATDGHVGVFEAINPNVGLVTKAQDLATCDTLWTISSPIGSLRDVWRVNTTLVQLSDDGTELMSLVAPG
jgi:hypothetical protein